MTGIDDIVTKYAVTNTYSALHSVLHAFRDTDAKIVLAMVGLPGSGKTTFADQIVEIATRGHSIPAIRTGRNETREALGHLAPGAKGVGTPEQERLVTAVHEWHVRELLTAGVRLVVQDSGNLTREHLEGLETVARENGACFLIRDMRHVPVSTCVARDAARRVPVGESVIRGMAERAGITAWSTV